MTARLFPTAARLASQSVLRAQGDGRLAELTREGSAAAFETIVARYRRPLIRQCARLLGDADAEDAVQEVFVRAHAALSDGERVRNLGPWLRTIAHHRAVSVLRRRAVRPELPDSEHLETIQVDDQAEQRAELRAVLTAVRSLPLRQRDAIVLQAVEGRSYDEIAVALGASPGAVAQLLNRARMTMREHVLALTPAAPLARWAAGLTEGTAAAPAVALSGGCVLGAKVCAAVLVPAALVALGPSIESGRAPRAPTFRSTGGTHASGRAGHGPAAAGSAGPAILARAARLALAARSAGPGRPASPGSTARSRVDVAAVTPPRATDLRPPPGPGAGARIPQATGGAAGDRGGSGPSRSEHDAGSSSAGGTARSGLAGGSGGPSSGYAAAAGPSRTGNDFNWLMKGDSTAAASPTSSMAGKRASVSSNSTRSSSLANAVPRQK